ncbi:hypothetical protein COLO4_19711 [Corchorus olitorius]|uniref:MYB-CC type transcription factor LHEQLE-containing domain-containing protein n=1 Tax=Corchorus olitorius TaxID=93759 RepID=A0A1R3J3X5_9ROSI|nr:hypothetical protein COLO4_19711 [Corchorus olitorius]
MLTRFKILSFHTTNELTIMLLSIVDYWNIICRGRKAKQTAKSQEEIDEKLHLRIETQKHVERCLEAQRRYLGMALERASKKLGDGYLGNAATENTILHGQASGTLAAIPGSSDVRTMATMPEFNVKQQNQYPTPTYDTLTPQANVSLQEVPSGYQPQSSSVQPAAPEELSTSFGYSEASSYKETFPAESGKKRARPADEEEEEDPIEAYLNWDDTEPINLDAAFNYDKLD